MTDLCIYAHYDRDSIVDPYVLRHLTAIRDSGFDIVFVTTGDISAADEQRLLPLCVDVIRRQNVGHDFGSWSTGLAKWRARATGRLLLANDSVYGPIGSLDAAIRKLTAVPADVYGMVLSHEIVPHLQTWFLLFEPRVAASTAFADIFCEPPVQRSRVEIVKRFELRATEHLRRAGFVCRALFEQSGDRVVTNPTAYRWQHLVEDAGVPFLKAGVMRDDPEGTMPDDRWRPFVGRTEPELLPLIDAHQARIRAPDRGSLATSRKLHERLISGVQNVFLEVEDRLARRRAHGLLRLNARAHKLCSDLLRLGRRRDHPFK